MRRFCVTLPENNIAQIEYQFLSPTIEIDLIASIVYECYTKNQEVKNILIRLILAFRFLPNPRIINNRINTFLARCWLESQIENAIRPTVGVYNLRCYNYTRIIHMLITDDKSLWLTLSAFSLNHEVGFFEIISISISGVETVMLLSLRCSRIGIVIQLLVFPK